MFIDFYYDVWGKNCIKFQFLKQLPMSSLKKQSIYSWRNLTDFRWILEHICKDVDSFSDLCEYHYLSCFYNRELVCLSSFDRFIWFYFIFIFFWWHLKWGFLYVYFVSIYCLFIFVFPVIWRGYIPLIYLFVWLLYVKNQKPINRRLKKSIVSY